MCEQKKDESWKEKFTAEELEIIKRYWLGKPATQCTGKCNVTGFLAAYCNSCGWHEEEPTSGAFEYQ